MTGTRRAFVGALALGALALAGGADAQESTSRRRLRIGRLSPLSEETDAPLLQAFRKALLDLGWVEGQTFSIESRFAGGEEARLPVLAAELVQRRVDLILTGSSPGARAARHATRTVPIVMVTTSDPVADGLVGSLARPGGNVTGVTALGQVLNVKRLELIKEAAPAVARVALLVDPSSPYTVPFLKEKDAAARTLGLELRTLEATDLATLDRVLTTLPVERVGAIMVQTNPLFITHRGRIVEQVAKARLPAVYGERQSVDAGGLMFYGASLADMYRHAAVYVDKIARGSKPADLPVEQATRLSLVVNLKAARAIGLTLPPSLLVRADEIIER